MARTTPQGATYVTLEGTAGVNIEGVDAPLPVYRDGQYLRFGGTLLPIKHAVIDHAASGDNAIVAAVPGKSIRVISGQAVAAGAVTVRFESGAGGTALTGQMSLAANGGFIIPETIYGAFWTAEGEALNLELGGAVSVDGWLNYVEVG